ncbi:Tripartite-type tricarboxylate transporter, receptor component TctC [Variovorax sp. OK605]|jgi:tripartite-type tricarboxylate transporter receptor subunit TctC|uniref:Bug family tripartite tricarboxylate transporter substrate binding protein n=1 Tax=unclassified Variovorax TaxID=663243 RepID=UPI0008B712CC|nr:MULTISPECIES: tripartite tricarboxylate transporter substrate binding protein [unclassified Variovorax]SEK08793.1 Tripartite-type tricarboxylate transporter, receptor component TctC [Variovorax sp. OK202]SFD58565.1 Tripartite-type tricarboxylate transporter, receptor component TctC [Variovorax sp. OK212]SFP84668.1 Tripartite-type tricarboxylate transporter, receptor component TctC [Variovorax sp. OK605]
MFQDTARRTLALVACAFLMTQAQAQNDNKVARLVVPFPAGGTADILPRVVADKLRDLYPGGVVVENRTGAGGNIGADVVYRSEPDGKTLLASPPAPIAINQHLYKKLAFDPARWVPVTVLATVPNVLVVNPKLPVRNVAEFIAYLKANPGKVSFASQGNGTTSHLTASLFMQLTGTTMTHVPYKGTAPALVDLIGGQVDVFFDNISSSLQFERTGKVRILAVADEQRSKALPNVPTFAEQKLPDMNAVTWFAVVAPPGTPAATVDATQKAMANALALPDVKQKFAEQGAEPRGWDSARTGQFIQAETVKWNKVIQSAKVTLE